MTSYFKKTLIGIGVVGLALIGLILFEESSLNKSVPMVTSYPLEKSNIFEISAQDITLKTLDIRMNKYGTIGVFLLSNNSSRELILDVVLPIKNPPEISTGYRLYYKNKKVWKEAENARGIPAGTGLHVRPGESRKIVIPLGAIENEVKSAGINLPLDCYVQFGQIESTHFQINERK